MPRNDLPQAVALFLARYPNVRAQKSTHHSPATCWEFRCRDCSKKLECVSTMVEGGDFRHWEGSFSEGKPCVDESTFAVICGCEGLTYDAGEEVERYS